MADALARLQPIDHTSKTAVSVGQLSGNTRHSPKRLKGTHRRGLFETAFIDISGRFGWATPLPAKG